MGVRDATASDAADIFRLLCGSATSYRPERAVFDRTYPQVLEACSAWRAELLIAGGGSGYALAVRSPTLLAGGTVLELGFEVTATYLKRPLPL